MLTIYKVLSFVIYPILPILLWVRQNKGKEDPIRKLEKLGKISKSRPKGKLVWIHCASVGEANSSLALIDELLKDKKLHVLMTTGTVSSANLMAKKLPKRAMHQFVPLDTPQIVNRFLNHWQPTSVIWTESEIWPNALLEIKKRNIPCASINATISEKSFNTWQKHPQAIKKILSTFTVTLAQTKKKVTMLKKLGSENVKCVGNLKFTTGAPAVDDKKVKELQKAISKRKVVCYSSTHKGEEDIAIRIHANLKKKFNSSLVEESKRANVSVARLGGGFVESNEHPTPLPIAADFKNPSYLTLPQGESEKNLTIILPRHPNRKNEIKALLEKTDLEFCFRSEGALPTAKTDIYVADTFGEIGTFYKVCPIVFMGGSLSPYHDGGHNPIEPAKFGCAVLSGPKISAFEEIFEAMRKATKIVKTEKALEKNLLELLKDKKKVNALSKEALKIVGEDNTIIEDIMIELKKVKVI